MEVDEEVLPPIEESEEKPPAAQTFIPGVHELAEGEVLVCPSMFFGTTWEISGSGSLQLHILSVEHKPTSPRTMKSRYTR